MRHSRLTRPIALALLAALAAAPAQAGSSIGAAGGYVIPWQGDPGFSISGEYFYHPEGRPWRFGGELEYRRYESELFGVDDIAIDTVQLRVLGHYLFDLGAIRPYVGLGVQSSINVIDDDEIENVLGVGVDETGASLGATAIAGLELPFSESAAFFAEARASLDAQLTEEDNHHCSCYDEDDEVDVENLGGFTARAGLRISF